MVIEIAIITFLIVLGVALLMAEIFLLPGITVAGIAGSISVIAGIVYAFVYVSDTAGYITIAATGVLFAITFVYLIKSNAMSHIALKTDIEAKVDQTELNQLKVGDQGICISRLNPIGKAEFNNTVIEVKSINGEFIDEGAKIQIVKIESSNALVELIPE